MFVFKGSKTSCDAIITGVFLGIVWPKNIASRDGCVLLRHGLEPLSWAAANGGVTNGGLRGVWPPFLEIGRNRPFSPFFCLLRPFPDGTKSTWEIQKTEEKGLFPQISSDLLNPPSLKPPFAAPQLRFLRSSSLTYSKNCKCQPSGRNVPGHRQLTWHVGSHLTHECE